MKRWLVLTSVIALGALSCDCGTPAMGTASQDAGVGGSPGPGADCEAQCCPQPTLGDPCAVGDGGVGDGCPTSTLCAGGLILPQRLHCVGGIWTADARCDGGAGVASNGCPLSQPTDGASCTLPDGMLCYYELVCPSSCDAGTSPSNGGAGSGCATANKAGSASCDTGKWHATPLGSCS